MRSLTLSGMDICDQVSPKHHLHLNPSYPTLSTDRSPIAMGQPHRTSAPWESSSWPPQNAAMDISRVLQNEENNFLVTTIDDYIRNVGQVEYRLAACLYELACTLKELSGFLNVDCWKPAKRGATRDTLLDRLDGPLYSRLTRSNWQTPGLDARTSLWNGFLGWERDGYRSTIANEQNQCDTVGEQTRPAVHNPELGFSLQSVSVFLDALTQTCVNYSINNEGSLFSQRDLENASVIYDNNDVPAGGLSGSAPSGQISQGGPFTGIVGSTASQTNAHNTPLSMPFTYSFQ
jgi:hypothetical protein